MAQPGNSFGSCACVIPRLGFFWQNVLRGAAGGRALPLGVGFHDVMCFKQFFPESQLSMQNVWLS